MVVFEADIAIGHPTDLNFLSGVEFEDFVCFRSVDELQLNLFLSSVLILIFSLVREGAFRWGRLEKVNDHMRVAKGNDKSMF